LWYKSPVPNMRTRAVPCPLPILGTGKLDLRGLKEVALAAAKFC